MKIENYSVQHFGFIMISFIYNFNKFIIVELMLEIDLFYPDYGWTVQNTFVFIIFVK